MNIIKIFVLINLINLFLFTNILEAKNGLPLGCLWKGLIAEAVSEGETGMMAVACCVRNRLNAGMNTGLVALKRKDLNQFVKRQGVKYELMAKRIVEKIFYNNSKDITFGATHYESINFSKPKWAYKMKITCQIGKHIFYK